MKFYKSNAVCKCSCIKVDRNKFELFVYYCHMKVYSYCVLQEYKNTLLLSFF